MVFQTLTSIAEQLAQVGMDKTLVESIITRLEKAKLYLKTDYKVECQAQIVTLQTTADTLH